MKQKAQTDYHLSLTGAVNEARTRDPQLGKLMLYQLSYYRVIFLRRKVSHFFSLSQLKNVILHQHQLTKLN